MYIVSRAEGICLLHWDTEACGGWPGAALFLREDQSSHLCVCLAAQGLLCHACAHQDLGGRAHPSSSLHAWERDRKMPVFPVTSSMQSCLGTV